MSCSAVARPDSVECAECGRKAPLVAAFINLLLTIFLVIIGFISGSKAILGNSLYAFKDLVTSLAVFLGLRGAEKPPDEEHPYGHGKVEFVSMLFVGVIIFVASLFLFFHSFRDVWAGIEGRLLVPQLTALWAGCISVVANYKLAGYLQCIGDRRNSPAILATAKHHHSDAVASLFVVLAISGAQMGLLFLDPLVAVIETLDLMRLSYGMVKDSLYGVLDGSIKPETKAEIESIARLVPGVRRVSRLNARQLGHGIWIDITIKVDHDRSAREGYGIGMQVKGSIIKAFGDVAHVSVSIEPYVP